MRTERAKNKGHEKGKEKEGGEQKVNQQQTKGLKEISRAELPFQRDNVGWF